MTAARAGWKTVSGFWNAKKTLVANARELTRIAPGLLRTHAAPSARRYIQCDLVSGLLSRTGSSNSSRTCSRGDGRLDRATAHLRASPGRDGGAGSPPSPHGRARLRPDSATSVDRHDR